MEEKKDIKDPYDFHSHDEPKEEEAKGDLSDFLDDKLLPKDLVRERKRKHDMLEGGERSEAKRRKTELDHIRSHLIPGKLSEYFPSVEECLFHLDHGIKIQFSPIQTNSYNQGFQVFNFENYKGCLKFTAGTFDNPIVFRRGMGVNRAPPSGDKPGKREDKDGGIKGILLYFFDSKEDLWYKFLDRIQTIVFMHILNLYKDRLSRVKEIEESGEDVDLDEYKEEATILKKDDIYYEAGTIQSLIKNIKGMMQKRSYKTKSGQALRPIIRTPAKKGDDGKDKKPYIKLTAVIKQGMKEGEPSGRKPTRFTILKKVKSSYRESPPLSPDIITNSLRIYGDQCRGFKAIIQCQFGGANPSSHGAGASLHLSSVKIIETVDPRQEYIDGMKVETMEGDEVDQFLSNMVDRD